MDFSLPVNASCAHFGSELKGCLVDPALTDHVALPSPPIENPGYDTASYEFSVDATMVYIVRPAIMPCRLASYD